MQESLKKFQEATKALQEEEAQVIAGKLTLQEVDDRSRTVHAPKFRRISEDFARVTLRPDDARVLLLSDLTKISVLITEMLTMDSTLDEGGNPHPVDPARFAAIETEVSRMTGAMKKHAEAIKRADKSL
jgi:hypothetical protein